MPNILIQSTQEEFLADLIEQLSLYAKDYSIFTSVEPETNIDIIILDEQSSKQDFYRTEYPKSPIIMIQKHGSNLDSGDVLNIFIEKPICLDALLNKIHSSINQVENTSRGYLFFNKYILRPIKKDIYNQRNKEVIKLTEKEVAIIKYLYRNKDKIVGKNELLQEVWGYSPDVTTHTIETHIYRLRQKVEHEDESAQLIKTEDGGYKLNF